MGLSFIGAIADWCCDRETAKTIIRYCRNVDIPLMVSRMWRKSECTNKETLKLKMMAADLNCSKNDWSKSYHPCSETFYAWNGYAHWTKFPGSPQSSNGSFIKDPTNSSRISLHKLPKSEICNEGNIMGSELIQILQSLQTCKMESEETCYEWMSRTCKFNEAAFHERHGELLQLA